MDADLESKMQAAIDYCRRHPHEKQAHIACKYGIHPVTLGRRVKGTQTSRRAAHRDQQLFSPGEEDAIVELCKLIADCGFPLPQDLLHHMAQDVLNEHNNDNDNNGVKEIHEIDQKWVE